MVPPSRKSTSRIKPVDRLLHARDGDLSTVDLSRAARARLLLAYRQTPELQDGAASRPA